MNHDVISEINVEFIAFMSKSPEITSKKGSD